MAHARITSRYNDGSEVEVEVGHDDECHPDLLDELVTRCARLFAEVCETEPEGESS